METYGAADLARLSESYPIPTTKRELMRRHAALNDGEAFVGLDKKGQRIPALRGSMDYYLVTPIPPFNSASGAAFGTFTTLKDISPVPLPNIFGNQLRPGSGILIEANGQFSTTGTPTLSIGVGYGNAAGGAGGVTLGATNPTATFSGAAAAPWVLYYNGVVVSVGTAGSILGQGYLVMGTSLIAASVLPLPATAAARTVAIDTTVSKAINVMAAWGTSSASNTITCYNVAALLLN